MKMQVFWGVDWQLKRPFGGGCRLCLESLLVQKDCKLFRQFSVKFPIINFKIRSALLQLFHADTENGAIYGEMLKLTEEEIPNFVRDSEIRTKELGNYLKMAT